MTVDSTHPTLGLSEESYKKYYGEISKLLSVVENLGMDDFLAGTIAFFLDGTLSKEHLRVAYMCWEGCQIFNSGSSENKEMN